jgi:hypothetical protein
VDWRGVVFGLVLAAAACSPPVQETQNPGAPEPGAGAQARIADPAESIRPLYERYRSAPAVATFPTLIDAAPWSDDMRAQLVAMMARSEARGEPILDFDPFVNAQDWEIQNVNVTTDGVVENSHATVRAAVTNAGFSEDIVYDLIWESDAWRVNNIRAREWDLRQIIAE